MLAINRGEIWNRVAAIIEENPGRYNFWHSFIPHPGGRGCLLGLAGEVLGMEPGLHVREVARALGYQGDENNEHPEGTVYEKLTHIVFYGKMKDSVIDTNWTANAHTAIRGLRELALEVAA